MWCCCCCSTRMPPSHVSVGSFVNPTSVTYISLLPPPPPPPSPVLPFFSHIIVSTGTARPSQASAVLDAARLAVLSADSDDAAAAAAAAGVGVRGVSGLPLPRSRTARQWPPTPTDSAPDNGQVGVGDNDLNLHGASELERDPVTGGLML
jgi:hypothetical protein